MDWKVSALGFGAMRLPKIGDGPGEIDEPESIEMIRHAIDRGVNYIDTAYPYHGGKSEPLVGSALENGYREKVRVATKSPSWLLEKGEDFHRILDEQLERSPVEWALLEKVAQAYNELSPVPCTACRYCMPCSRHK